ncbi:LysM repeat-containing protein [Georgenia satyanarayanai]|uniref:LysM repeat-containing protein n=1 Tax=Georgenia satyanarayanai TaxID=860221 RepID=A0A2Y9A2S6_9MICO|nr:lytic transglycosylase domain-containing protein [Georgenia satyanarayanai]PYG02018.1 LysM repeat protein [Georgenia satyanarayanai]SSA36829.1 LysM repeat-containing protein [Georgenia satyanarayanai]
MKARTHTRAPRPVGRAGVGLVLAATTVAAMTVPAGAATAATAAPTVGATALALTSPATQRSLPTGTYLVRAGDTVSAIAARAGTTVSAIVSANNLGSQALIRVGQVLRLPAGKAATAAPTSATTHTVAAGDTVSALAKRYGTTVERIVSANRLDSRALIIIGQRLTIPGTSAPATGVSAAPAASRSATASARSHVVRAGDTVSGIAQRYGTTVERIASANGLRNPGLIRIGQRLTVSGGGSASAAPAAKPATPAPSATTASRTHVVAAGDTVSGLASRYGSTTSAIISANNLSGSGLIYVGQRLTVPGASGAPASASGGGQLVGSTFLGRTYASDVVGAANTNKATLLSMSVPSRDQMRAMVRDTAVSMGVDPALALAIAQQESGFDMRAVSPANAVGVMQVIPSSGQWASDLVGRRLNLLDPQDNVVAGVAILRQLVRTADSFDQAVAGYYQGLAGVKRNGMYADTRNYVAGIKTLMRQF